MRTRKCKFRKCKFRKYKSRKCKSRKYKSRKYKSRKRGGQPDKEVWRITRAIEPILNYFPRKFETRRKNKNNLQVVYEYMQEVPTWENNAEIIKMLKDQAGENVFEQAKKQFQAQKQRADTLQSLQDMLLSYGDVIVNKNLIPTAKEAQATAELQDRVNKYLKLKDPEERNKIFQELQEEEKEKEEKEKEEEEEEEKLF